LFCERGGCTLEDLIIADQILILVCRVLFSSWLHQHRDAILERICARVVHACLRQGAQTDTSEVRRRSDCGRAARVNGKRSKLRPRSPSVQSTRRALTALQRLIGRFVGKKCARRNAHQTLSTTWAHGIACMSIHRACLTAAWIGQRKLGGREGRSLCVCAHNPALLHAAPQDLYYGIGGRFKHTGSTKAAHETLLDTLEALCFQAGIKTERCNIPSVTKPNGKIGWGDLVLKNVNLAGTATSSRGHG